MMTENVPSTIQEVQKSQFLRVIDVLVLGPLIIFASTKIKDRPLQYALIASGALIIANNLRNYLKNK